MVFHINVTIEELLIVVLNINVIIIKSVFPLG